MPGPQRVLVTGANGFIGSAVLAALDAAGMTVVAAGRSRPASPVEVFHDVGPLHGATDWSAALAGCDAVVHLAARTHGSDLSAAAAVGEYTRVNVEASAGLAAQAAASGVKRVIYMSSVKVNGESHYGPPDAVPVYSGSDVPAPEDNYGRTKWAAERVLKEYAEKAAFDLTILRPPLVYGPGQKGNLHRLMNWIAACRPLPLASIVNRRSMIYVHNLADAVTCALRQDDRGVRTLTIADVEVSTPQLIRAVAGALEVEPRLWPLPPLGLKLLAEICGARAAFARLAGSLRVDAADAERSLGWQPRVLFAAALDVTARCYRPGGS